MLQPGDDIPARVASDFLSLDLDEHLPRLQTARDVVDPLVLDLSDTAELAGLRAPVDGDVESLRVSG